MSRKVKTPRHNRYEADTASPAKEEQMTMSTRGADGEEKTSARAKRKREQTPSIPKAEHRQLMTAIVDGIAEGLDSRKRAEGTLPPETTIIIHEERKNGRITVDRMYVKTRGIVQRAMELLEVWNFQPASIRGSRLPVDIIALRDDMDMLIQVISSKHPIPDAKTLIERYRKKIDDLRLMGTATRFRKILMAWSMPCGWKHYDVLPGGLKPAWDLHMLPTG